MISVLIPAHNKAGEINKLQELSSLRGLVHRRKASSDGIREIVQESASRNRKLIVTLSNTLTGMSGNMKQGLAAATRCSGIH
jgi:hypothetical protein